MQQPSKDSFRDPLDIPEKMIYNDHIGHETKKIPER